MTSAAKAWRGLSTLMLVVVVAALLVGPGMPPWGWIALIASGVAFAVELVLIRRERRRS